MLMSSYKYFHKYQTMKIYLIVKTADRFELCRPGSPHVKESGFRNPGHFCCGIRNSGKLCLWNPKS